MDVDSRLSIQAQSIYPDYIHFPADRRRRALRIPPSLLMDPNLQPPRAFGRPSGYDLPVGSNSSFKGFCMRAVLQRVTRSSVEVEGSCVGQIGRGWLVLLGVERDDTEADAVWMAAKVLNLRAFEDEQGKMNRSVVDVGGGILVVSQFTLLGDCRGGRRPSFTAAAEPADAERLYLHCAELMAKSGLEVAKGVFRAMMMVELVNDGPVTFLLDSRRAF